MYALDLRGHGESDRPAGGYAMRDLAADVLAFMDDRRLTRVTVVGHSMGSFVAQQLALAAPERIARLVLIGSGTTPRQIVGIAELDSAVQSLRDPVPVEFVREFQVGTVYQPISDKFLDGAINESRKLPARVWQGLMAGMLATDPPAGLSGKRIPTAIFWGDRDATFGRSEQDALVTMIDGAELAVYPETGHALHWERPAEFARDLHAFLERTTSYCRRPTVGPLGLEVQRERVALLAVPAVQLDPLERPVAIPGALAQPGAPHTTPSFAHRLAQLEPHRAVPRVAFPGARELGARVAVEHQQELVVVAEGEPGPVEPHLPARGVGEPAFAVAHGIYDRPVAAPGKVVVPRLRRWPRRRERAGL